MCTHIEITVSKYITIDNGYFWIMAFQWFLCSTLWFYFSFFLSVKCYYSCIF